MKSCPRLHFLPDFEKVIKRHEFYVEVPRATFKRRNYARFLISKVTQEAERFNLDEEKLRQSLISQNSSQDRDPSVGSVSLDLEMQPPANEWPEIKKDPWVINNEKEKDELKEKNNELEKNYEFGTNTVNQDKGLEIHLMKVEDNYELKSIPKSPKSPAKKFAPLWELNMIKTWESDIEQQPRKENHDSKQNIIHSLKSMPRSPCSPTKKIAPQWEVNIGRTGDSDQEQTRREKSILVFERMKNFTNYFPKMNCNEIISEFNKRAFFERLHRTGTQREPKTNMNLKKYTFFSQKILQIFREGNNPRDTLHYDKTPLAPLLRQRRRKITTYESFFERKNADHRKSFRSVVASMLNQPYLNLGKPIPKKLVFKFKNILKAKSKFFK